MKKIEKDHIAAFGEERFAKVLAKTSMVVRQDSRLTGLDKIRIPLAFEAALCASGFPPRGFSLGKTEIPEATMRICEDLLAKAIEAAQPQRG